ncbi:hypothetical protein BC835DRAFT_738645 [Cytidiella melzeri]|nr:hypothetical protein BC835DRAFT_1337476 [Cytidiella melzeri]KAI0697810.1 hypothetical protein BC835DRAFT_738645 [Cytidiella melzeri]
MMFFITPFKFLCALLVLASFSNARRRVRHENHHGIATVFWTAEGPGTCGYTTAPADYFVAIPSGRFKRSECGNIVSVTASQTGATVSAQVVEQCPQSQCSVNDLGVSYAIFTALGGVLGKGVNVQWGGSGI